MLREIYEQPAALRETLEQYVAGDSLRAERFGAAQRLLARHRKVVIAASGSSRHAGLAAELMLEDTAALPVDVVRAPR